MLVCPTLSPIMHTSRSCRGIFFLPEGTKPYRTTLRIIKIHYVFVQAVIDAASAEPVDRDVEAQGDQSQPTTKTKTKAKGRRGRRNRRRDDSDSDSDAGVKKEAKHKLVFGMLTDRHTRHTRAMSATTGWAVSLVIVGIIFLILVILGDYPTTVENQKYLNIYETNLAKYSIYIAAGLLAIVGTTSSLRAVRTGGSTSFGNVLLIVSIVGALATIGITGYTISKGPDYGAEWWSYLISAFIILQRILFAIAASCAVATLNDAAEDPEVAAVVADSSLL